MTTGKLIAGMVALAALAGLTWAFGPEVAEQLFGTVVEEMRGSQ